MSKPFIEIALANGIVTRLVDKTHRYFGDYYRITLEGTTFVPILAEHFDDMSLFDKALEKFGPSISIPRKLEKMAVPSARVMAEKQRLLQTLELQLRSFYNSSDVPKRIVESQLQKFGYKAVTGYC